MVAREQAALGRAQWSESRGGPRSGSPSAVADNRPLGLHPPKTLVGRRQIGGDRERRSDARTSRPGFPPRGTTHRHFQICAISNTLVRALLIPLRIVYPRADSRSPDCDVGGTRTRDLRSALNGRRLRRAADRCQPVGVRDPSRKRLHFRAATDRRALVPEQARSLRSTRAHV